MSIVSAIVLYAVTWFMTMFVALPIGLRTQGDDGVIVEGTHAGAPSNYNPRRKAVIVTLVAFVIWGIIVGVIYAGVFSWEDFDWTARLPKVGDS
jgi:predicted secreted protein